MSAPVVPETEPAGLLSDTTLADLQLRRQPFAELAPDEDAFADGTTNEQLSDIKQALITGDDLLLVLGETGAGKSTLLAQLGSNSGLRIQCFAVRGSDRFSTHNLFGGMLEAFKQAPPDDLKDMLDALVPCLQRMVANNILSAIVLDNADSVTDGELTRLLSSMLYLNSQDETLMRVVLAADDSFEDRIPELLPEGADLPYSSLSVEPFDVDRANAYLTYRLHQAGWMNPLPFSDEELVDIHTRSGGRPRLLHQEAAGVLEARSRGEAQAPGVGYDAAHEPAYEQPYEQPYEQQPFEQPFEQQPFEQPYEPHYDAGFDPEPAALADAAPPPAREPARAGGVFGRGLKLALGAVAVALIGAGLWLSRPTGGTDADQEFVVLEQRPVGSQELSLAQEEAGSSPAPAEIGEASQEGNTDIGTTQSGSAEPTATEASGTVAAPDTPPVATPEPGASPGEAAQADARPTGDRPEALPLPEPSAQPPTDDELLEPLTNSEGASASDADGLAADVPADSPIDPAIDSPAERPAEPPTPDEQAEPASTESAATVLEPSTWILLQEPDQFTVQMSASTDRASVENFLRRAELSGPNSIFAFDRDGATWYALVHGLFTSIDDARAAVEAMPAQAQSNQPWIRAVGRIQAVLKEQN